MAGFTFFMGDPWDSSGFTLAHVAASAGMVGVLKALRGELKCSVVKKNDGGCLPAHFAAWHGNTWKG